MKQRKLLIVSYLFPPAGGIGVQRALSLAKYLPRHGFEVHVLQAKNAAGPVRDPALLAQVPPCVTRHEAFTPELPFELRQRLWKRLGASGPAAQTQTRGWKRLAKAAVQRILRPEPEVLWTPFAVRRAAAVVKRYGVDAVLVTAPPFSSFLIGTSLKRRFPQLKFIADFRDEWLRFYLRDFAYQSGERTRRRAEAIERATVESADLVAAVTRSSLDEIRGRYPDQPDSKFTVVPNGYDPEAFEGFRARPHEGARIVVTHAGTAYKTASPRYYLDALESLPGEMRDAFETRFVGRISEEERGLFAGGRRSAVRLLGFLPQAEAIRQMEETDCLLLTMTDEISLPGKLFEYLATGKPILAISPTGGEVERLIRETHAGWCADPRDPAAVAAMLRTACRAMRDGAGKPQPNREKIRSYERPRLADEYAQLLDSLFAANA